MGEDPGDAEVVDLDVPTLGYDEVVYLVVMVPEDVGMD